MYQFLSDVTAYLVLTFEEYNINTIVWKRCKKIKSLQRLGYYDFQSHAQYIFLHNLDDILNTFLFCSQKCI